MSDDSSPTPLDAFAPHTDEKTEPVLCVRTDWATRHIGEGFTTPGSLSQMLDSREIHVIPRHHAETDDDFLQIIPYAVVAFLTEGLPPKILGYQREGSEDRLYGRGSIGLGGHLGLVDGGYRWEGKTAYIDVKPTIEVGLHREIDEEVGVSPFRYDALGTIYDPSDEVGSVHLGLCYLALVDEDRYSVTPSDEIGQVYTGSLTEVRSNLVNVESWTNIVIESGVLPPALNRVRGEKIEG